MRPDLNGLEAVIRAANVLNGDRHAPELPLPYTTVRGYADRYNMSGTFVNLIMEYDRALLTGYAEIRQKAMKKGKKGVSVPSTQQGKPNTPTAKSLQA